MKYLLGVFMVFLLESYQCLDGSEKSATEAPNIVLILADDLGYGDLSLTGSKQIKTPHIDQIAKKGIFFRQAYVSSSVCSPSRAGLITGKNQVTFGFDNNAISSQLGFDPAYLGLPTSEKTVARLLKKGNYTSSLIGKWHLGETEDFHPLNRGFDEFWGYRGGGHDYFESSPDGKHYYAPIESSYKKKIDISYLTDDKGDECVSFIERNKDKPFFLYASFNAPHTPLQATEEDLKLYEHIEDKKRRTYAAMVHRLDVNVGKIITSLKKNGIYENTIVVFLSDNGGPVHVNSSINAPFNGQKGILLEGGIRVPFIISWPNRLPENIQYDQVVSSLDLTPTFLSAADIGYDESRFDGVNLLPYLTGEKSENPHNELKWRFAISAAIREGDWKLIRVPDRLPMLYNLKSDISEQHDLALENIDITKLLLNKLGIWDVKLPHPLFLEGAEWKIKNLENYDKDYPIVQPQ